MSLRTEMRTSLHIVFSVGMEPTPSRSCCLLLRTWPRSPLLMGFGAMLTGGRLVLLREAGLFLTHSVEEKIAGLAAQNFVKQFGS